VFRSAVKAKAAVAKSAQILKLILMVTALKSSQALLMQYHHVRYSSDIQAENEDLYSEVS
jgi:hypothetical protein